MGENKMEKQIKTIGVVTFWNSKDNYGQLLQCFALTRFLKNMGYSPKLIKCDLSEKTNLFHKVKTFLLLILSPFKMYEVILNKKIRKNIISANTSHPRHFDDFRNKYIPSTEVFHVREISSKLPYFDIFVTGSDQVWGSLLPYYFLDFVPKGRKKIAYAVSMGGYKPTGKDLLAVKDLIRSFDYVSLREKQSCDFFEQNKICEVDCVPDPTLLLTRDDYKRLYQEKKVEKHYIFLYLLGNKSQFDLNEVYQYAKEKKLDVVYVASQGRDDQYPKEYPTIEEWLALIENAEMVLTNSFHGTVFSIIYRKKFATILLTGPFAKMNDRITDMLKKYGLENRILSASIEKYERDVDYSLFEKRICEERAYVKEKLLSIIG